MAARKQEDEGRSRSRGREEQPTENSEFVSKSFLEGLLAEFKSGVTKDVSALGNALGAKVVILVRATDLRYQSRFEALEHSVREEQRCAER